MLIERLIERRATVVNPLHPGDPGLAVLFGLGNESSTGKSITPSTSVKVTAALAAGRYLAESIAQLPLILYERLERGKRRATEDPLYKRLHDQPNRYQTRFEWIEMLVWHALFRGNAYAELIPSREIPPFEMIPLHPERVTPFWTPKGLPAYEFQPLSGQKRIILNREMLHLRFLPKDGLTGETVIAHAAEALGFALTAQEYGGRTLAQGQKPGGILKHKATLSKEAKERLIDHWRRRFYGVERVGRTALLEEGMEYQEIGILPEEAQLLESRKFSIEEIARAFRVPPHKIGHLEHATFSNIEHQAIEAVQDSLGPWLVRLEQTISRDLLGYSDSFFAEFLVAHLLRGDQTARYNAYSIGRNGGWLSANDIRELENMNPVEGGDVYLVPLNMVPADQVGMMEEPTEDAPDEPAAEGQPPDSAALPEARRELPAAIPAVTQVEQRIGPRGFVELTLRLRRRYRRILTDAAERLLRREIRELKDKLKKFGMDRSQADFEDWLSTFYSRDFKPVIQRTMGPVITTYAEAVRDLAADKLDVDPADLDISAFMASYLSAFVSKHAGNSQASIMALLKDKPPAELVEAFISTVDDWPDSRAESIASEESVRTGGAVLRAAWAMAGVTKLVWVTLGADSCPLCQELNGQVVGIEQDFSGSGEQIDAPGRRPLTTSKTSHPPLHRGCVCTIQPE